MAYQRWSWLLDGETDEEADVGVESMISATAADLLGEWGYPTLFSVTEGLGFFAVGPGEGLLYYFDRRRDTAFLFPKPVR